MADNSKYRSLNFNHSEINDLLKKIKEGFVFSEAEYKKLIEEIGLDNISTFDGDYEKLMNQPAIPVKVSELANDANFQNGEIVDGKIANAIKQVEKLLEPKLDEEDMAELQEAINKINADMSLKMDKEAGKGLMNVDEIARLAEVKNYDDAELRQMIEAKANKEDLFNKDYNELINKPEIPSIQGLATEMYVDEKITDLIDFAPDAMNTLKELANAIEEHQDIYEAHVQGQAELLNAKVDKQEGFGLMDEAEMARLAEVDNYNDEELRALLEEKANKDELFNKDYNELMNLPEIPSIEGLASEEFVKAEIAAIEHPQFDDTELKERIEVLETLNLETKPYVDKNGMLVLCGCPAIAKGVGKEVHVIVRFFNNEEDKFIFTADEFAKLRICMGFGAEGVGHRRNIAETTLELYDIDKAFIIDGGSQITGEIGTVNIIAENVNYIDGIQGARAMNGGERNIVHNFNVKVKDVKLIDTLYGGGNGFSVVWNSNVEVDGNTEINFLVAGGSNGFTNKSRIVMNNGHAKIMQGVNRGILNRAELILNGGIVDNLYAAGDASDASVTGIQHECHIELNGGEVAKFAKGNSNLKEFEGNIEGTIINCNVVEGDISMLEKIEMPVDPKLGDCVFNEKLNKPIWFNGQNWVDANGLIVG